MQNRPYLLALVLDLSSLAAFSPHLTAPVLESASSSHPSFPSIHPAESSGALCMPNSPQSGLQGFPQSEPSSCKEPTPGRTQTLPAQVPTQPGHNSAQARRLANPAELCRHAHSSPVICLQLPLTGPVGFLEGTSQGPRTISTS